MKALDFLVNLKQSRDFDGNLESSLDEAIAELEELQQPNICDGCRWESDYHCNPYHCKECKYFYTYYDNNFEPKEQ